MSEHKRYEIGHVAFVVTATTGTPLLQQSKGREHCHHCKQGHAAHTADEKEEKTKSMWMEGHGLRPFLWVLGGPSAKLVGGKTLDTA